MNTQTPVAEETLDSLFKVGAHYGVAKARRHPTAQQYLFGQKDKIDLFDLAKTQEALEVAQDFVRSLAAERKQVVFVGGKAESHKVVRTEAERVGAAYSVGRWIGGTITNFSEIKKRVARMVDLMNKRDTGDLTKYTKFERLQIDREIEKLQSMYAGLVPLKEKLPAALFVIDPRREAIAVREARLNNIPVIAVANSDCNFDDVDYVIPANDAALRSIAYFVRAIADAYAEGATTKPSAAAVQQ